MIMIELEALNWSFQLLFYIYAKRQIIMRLDTRLLQPLRVGVIHAIFDRLEFSPKVPVPPAVHRSYFYSVGSPAKFKISVDVQPMCFGHLNHCVDYCAGIRSVHGTAEQPVFFAPLRTDGSHSH